MHSNAGRNFNGEIFAVGDYLGGILLHECLKRSGNHCQSHQIVSRNSSSLSTKSHIIVNENRQQISELNLAFWRMGSFKFRKHG
ncbi:unnamed protein product [Onchocerca flexuosa]|uniref:Uncharacterized protein n=1 Tax=Onchocerca flexuosa TaxID=387005 RepID=A0A183HRS9_9BILA|nr:unnamed protein product [Onchocerca flexuosa]